MVCMSFPELAGSGLRSPGEDMCMGRVCVCVCVCVCVKGPPPLLQEAPCTHPPRRVHLPRVGQLRRKPEPNPHRGAGRGQDSAASRTGSLLTNSGPHCPLDASRP
ncbi:unnamed protein product [Rangifer tarandus platyrhynchus]|uniref:Uncharacterized protein n=1 Tax=Rangifer tarandus platyrhynchus TaxID=3082113 RepID=A0ABN8YQZ2_RANTA|nr:unnamed protein product [Rangifer tarandus platyrhynchus]